MSKGKASFWTIPKGGGTGSFSAYYNAQFAAYMASPAVMGVSYSALDCSGGVSKGIQQINPNFQRTSAQGLFDNWTVPADGPSTGTLMFYDDGGSTRHVTTVINETEMVHASSRQYGKSVITPIKSYVGYKNPPQYRNLNWYKIMK